MKVCSTASLASLKTTMEIILIQLFILQSVCRAQQTQTNIVLEQGALLGLKIFPDSSRTAVYAFLGIPYAQPPAGDLRFASPKPHNGWNGTLQAMSMQPICPQLTNTVYDESADGTLARPPAMDEDCLYLNIWVAEVGMNFGNLPVLVIITGEEMSYDWARNRVSGLDFAAEGTVVVGVQYRTNIFGWINLDNQELPGNYGLQDQQLALKWIQRNIHSFGGNPNQITLLGHGTTGAPCVMAHILMTLEGKNPLFSKVILMSGGDLDVILNSDSVIVEASRVLIQKLGCHFEERRGQVVSCLRMKSVSDLQKAFESVYDHGNGTLTLGPLVSPKLHELLANRAVVNSLPQILVGITSNEGAFLQDYWLDMARDSYQVIRAYVNYTVLPNVLRRLLPNKSGEVRRIIDALNWRYFSGESAVSVGYLLNAMQSLISEYYYETPFYRTLELLSSRRNGSDQSPPIIYAYIFEVSNSMDMRGKVNLFGGASHASDLPLLLGPSLFQQIARRRFTADEEKICRKIRTAFVNFAKSGNPTPGRIYDAWLPYTQERKFIFSLGELVKKDNAKPVGAMAIFERNLPQIEKLLEADKPNGVVGIISRSNRNEYSNPYQAAIGQSITDGRRTKSYLTNQLDSGYSLHLKRVYGFWHILLPNMAAYDGDGTYEGINDALGNRIRLMEASADAARYKQGFFAMLGLVAVLLTILGLCVYLLRRDPLSMPTHSPKFCL